MIYERIKFVLPNATPQFPRREVAKVVRIADRKREDEKAKNGRKRDRSSRSNLIKDTVRIAKRTNPRDERRDEAGRKEPVLIPSRRGGARRYAVSMFFPPSRPPLRYITGGLVPFWWSKRHSRPPAEYHCHIRALSWIPHNKGRLDYLLPRLKLPFPLPFFAEDPFSSEDQRNEISSLTMRMSHAIRRSNFTCASKYEWSNFEQFKH